MAKNKTCAYCGTHDKKELYHRLPNGLFDCTDCHRKRNPLWIAGQVQGLTKAKKSDMVFKSKQAEEDFDKAKEKAKKMPPMHHMEANPLIRQAYRKLLKGKKVAGSNISPTDGA